MNGANAGAIFYYSRQYDLAIETYRKTLDLDKDYWLARMGLGITYGAKGDLPDALQLRRDVCDDMAPYLSFLDRSAGGQAEMAAAVQRDRHVENAVGLVHGAAGLPAHG